MQIGVDNALDAAWEVVIAHAGLSTARINTLFFFLPRTLRLVQPFARLDCLGVIEVTDLRLCKWLAEDRHAVLPLLVPNHREPVDVGEVPDGELRVLPRRTELPAVEVA